MNTWENSIRKEFGTSKSRLNPKRIVLEKFDELEFFHTNHASKIAIYFLRRMSLRQGILSFIVRSFLTRLFRFDPLKNLQVTPIEIFFLVAKKDLEILPYSIVSALVTTSNPINLITVVCPTEIVGKVSEKVAKISKSSHAQIVVETDEQVLERSTLKDFKFFSSVSKMEIIKICIPLNSERNILVIDSDTLLLRERNWLSNVIQVTPIAQEYLIGHNVFLNQQLKFMRNSGLGFVTHHGLLRGTIVTDLVEKCGGIKKLASAIDNGVAKGWDELNGFPSEWQLYGEFLIAQEDESLVTVASFVNLGITRSILPIIDSPNYTECLSIINRLRKCCPKLGSLSLHAYK